MDIGSERVQKRGEKVKKLEKYGARIVQKVAKRMEFVIKIALNNAKVVNKVSKLLRRDSKSFTFDQIDIKS